MKEFIIFYNHDDYGYYSTKVEALNISDALEDWFKYWKYKTVYGIMEVR